MNGLIASDRKRWKSVAWRLVGILSLCALLQMGHWLVGILPTPIEVIRAFGQLLLSAEFWQDLAVSLARVSAGLALASGFALLLSFMCFLSASAANLIESSLSLIRPIPPITWIPLSVAIFGLSETASIFVIFVGAFFPIFSSSTQALTFEGRAALVRARLIQGYSIRHFFQIVVPASLPTIFTGLSVAIGFGWMVVVVAEMISVKSGLGYQIQIERQLLRLDFVVAYMAVIGIVGALLGSGAAMLRDTLMPHLRAARDDRQIKVPTDPSPSGEKIECADEGGVGLSLRNVDYSYDPAAPVLSGINLDLAPGDLLAIVGPSGSGKTTLLNILAGALKPTNGTIIATEGVALPDAAGWVFQQDGLFDWMTVRRNVEFGISPSGESLHPSVDKWLSLTGIQSFADRFPASLSGGQRQRVQIARALASQRRIVLLDEPFSALDTINRQVLIPAIRSLLQRYGRTCVLVTHDIRDAIRFADRICVIDDKNHGIAAIVPIALNGVDERESEQAVAQNFDKIWSVLKRSDTTQRDGRLCNE